VSDNKLHDFRANSANLSADASCTGACYLKDFPDFSIAFYNPIESNNSVFRCEKNCAAEHFPAKIYSKPIFLNLVSEA